LTRSPDRVAGPRAFDMSGEPKAAESRLWNVRSMEWLGAGIRKANRRMKVGRSVEPISRYRAPTE